MKVQLATLFTVLLVGGSMASKSFSKFQVDFDKKYSSPAELKYRQAIFEANLKEIEEHNAKYERGEVTWYMGVNQFTDMTPKEFQEMFHEFELEEPNPEQEAFSQMILDEIHRNGTKVEGAILDWRAYGVVSGAKDQGACGSCAAFAATGALESCFALKSGGQVADLSEQFMVDCGVGFGLGCMGGNPGSYFTFIKTLHGGLTETEQAYPYVAATGSCHHNANGYYQYGRMTNYVSKQLLTNENDLMGLVSSYGPEATAINGLPIQSYAGGIFQSSECCDAAHTVGCSLKNNHAVLVVGYGSENGLDYWIVKNSWGSWYGENGFFKIKRGSGHCGIGYKFNGVPIC